jgi:hypothetical protein
MIARTVFHASSDDYLPGSTVFWGISRPSRIAQPPVLATRCGAFETMGGTHSTPRCNRVAIWRSRRARARRGGGGRLASHRSIMLFRQRVQKRTKSRDRCDSADSLVSRCRRGQLVATSDV